MYKNFQEIPQYNYGNSQGTVGFKYLEKQLQIFIEEYSLELNPEFQRDYVWTKSQKEKYVEFILKGGNSAKNIYFNYPNYDCHILKPYDINDPILNRMVIVDGKQRLSAILGFLNNEVKAFGSYYKDFKGVLRSYYRLNFNIGSLTTREEVLNWYLDFNSGGTVHTHEELDKVKKLIAQTKKQATPEPKLS